MTQEVTDVRSNPNDQIDHAKRVIGLSKDRRKVFIAISTGKNKIRRVEDVVKATGLRRKRVLEEAAILANNQIIIKDRDEKGLFYQRDRFYSQNKKKILNLIDNKKAAANFATKTRPKMTVTSIVAFPKDMVKIKHITIDDLDSFSKVRKVKRPRKLVYAPIDEKKFKEGVKRILGETGEFQDWGGEKNDLLTTRLKKGGKRYATAFGFKGKGTTGILTPKKMGKRGDQVQRLLGSPAQIFLVQYWGQIDDSILEQMKEFAKTKSWSDGNTIYYGIIDGYDTQRLMQAYKRYFT